MKINMQFENINLIFDENRILKEQEETASHFHIYYEFQFILGGSCIIGNDNSAHIAKTGDLVIIPPHVVHYVRPHDMFSRYVMAVRISKAGNNPKNKDYEKLISRLSSLDSITLINTDCTDLIKEGLRHLNSESTFNNLYTGHFLMMLLSKATDSIGSSQSEKATENGYFPEIIIDRYISDTKGNPNASLCELAEKLNLSTKQTERIVYNLTGTTLKKLILRQRMNIALELLKTTSLPVSEIAIKCGYNSYDVFFKAFVKYYNAKPSFFRKNNEDF